MNDWLGLDVGGANLKVADGHGFAVSRPFALWRQPQRLATELERLLAEAPAAEHVAVTMTGEIADCFRDPQEGVGGIIDATVRAAGSRRVHVYLTDGRLVPPEAARREPMQAAASNWRALAQFALRLLDQRPGLLIDVGSTTTDLIPLEPDRVAARGATDLDRLLAGELVYTGVERSPLCAVVRQVPYRGRMIGVAQELFATMGDVYRVLGELPEQPDDAPTADGRPATRPEACQRLRRMILADAARFGPDDARRLALAAADAQLQQLADAARRVLDRPTAAPATVVTSGQGEFLGQRLLERLGLTARVRSLSRLLSPATSRCAPAHALAVLAREQLP